jgi:hypothetical protein
MRGRCAGARRGCIVRTGRVTLQQLLRHILQGSRKHCIDDPSVYAAICCAASSALPHLHSVQCDTSNLERRHGLTAEPRSALAWPRTAHTPAAEAVPRARRPQRASTKKTSSTCSDGVHAELRCMLKCRLTVPQRVSSNATFDLIDATTMLVVRLPDMLVDRFTVDVQQYTLTQPMHSPCWW